MQVCALLLLLETLLNPTTAEVYSLRYFHTVSSGVPNVPEFVSVGFVNDLQITHYDSDSRRYVPKQEWMKKMEPQYWEKNTQICLENQQTGRATIEEAKQRFNVTEGMHLWQNMFGCDWNDETNEITGYDQYAFDGEDFISFDFETETFVAPKQQAFITKLNWEKNGYNTHQKNYIHRCVEYLKRFVLLGASALKRTVHPVVSLLQKSSSALVTCHATGFYPDRARLFWTRDGDELHEGVDPGEILPNGDGTYQTSVDLNLSWVPPEDWGRYDCVFQLSGVKEEHITWIRPGRTKISTNEKSSTSLSLVVTIIVLAVFLTVTITVLAAVACVLFWKLKNKRPMFSQREQDVLQEQNLRCLNSSSS